MEKEIDIKKLSLVELKALVYDELVTIELWQKHISNCQARIKAINEQINIKKSEEE